MDIIPIEYQNDYELLLKHINAYKNGVTSDSMQSYGIAYKKNFGASIIDLRRVSERFSTSANLAELLWNKEWRETYILATLLDDSTLMSAEKLSSRLESAPTFEVLEQLAYNLAWQLTYLDSFFDSIEGATTSEKVQYFLLKCTTYQLMKNTITAQQAWNRIAAYHFLDQTVILNVLQNLMLRITAIDNSLHANVVEFCHQQGKSDRWQMLKDIVKEYGIL